MDDPKDVFRTHCNYIRAFAYLASGGWASREQVYQQLFKRIVRSRSSHDKENSTCDHDHVRRILEIGWGTELLMVLGCSIIDDDELIRLSNNWNAVQCYYVVYHAIQALAVAKGFPRPDSHPKTQKVFADFWAQPSRDIAPWTISAHDDSYQNVPVSISINPNIHSWTTYTGTNSWSLVCKALRTTRDDLVGNALRKRREIKRASKKKEWHNEEIARIARGRRSRKEPKFPLPRLTVTERREVNVKTRCTTIIDYLFRVRIKTNYEDSAMFTDGPEDAQVSNEIRNCLCLLAATTLFLHEVYIASFVGKGRFLAWIEEWISQKLTRDFQSGLVERYAVHKELLKT